MDVIYKFEISVVDDSVCFENVTAFIQSKMFVCYKSGLNKLDYAYISNEAPEISCAHNFLILFNKCQ